MSEYIKRNHNKILIFTLVFIAILIWTTVFRLPDDDLHIKVLDVGQGDSIFIQTPAGYKILVDGGPNNQVLDYLGAELPFYDKTLDLVVLTHPDKDHLTGLIEVVKRYDVKSLWVGYGENDTAEYEEWLSLLESETQERTVVWSGDKMEFPDEVSLQVVWPKGESASSKLNASSVVIMIDFRDFEGLLTGDADKNYQPYTSPVPEIEFLKVPHHGAKEALNESYTKSLSPEVSVVSVGSRNRYGHPHSKTMGLLASTGSQIFRTDENGTVEIVTNGSSWSTTTQR